MDRESTKVHSGAEQPAMPNSSVAAQYTVPHHAGAQHANVPHHAGAQHAVNHSVQSTLAASQSAAGGQQSEDSRPVSQPDVVMSTQVIPSSYVSVTVC